MNLYIFDTKDKKFTNYICIGFILLCNTILFIFNLNIFIQNIKYRIYNKKIILWTIIINIISIILYIRIFCSINKNIIIIYQHIFQELTFFTILSVFLWDFKKLNIKPKLSKALLFIFAFKFIYTILDQFYKYKVNTYCNYYYLGVRLIVYLFIGITFIILNIKIFGYLINLIHNIVYKKEEDLNENELYFNQIDHTYFISSVFQFRIMIINFYLVYFIYVFKLIFFFIISFNPFFNTDCNLDYNNNAFNQDEVWFYHSSNDYFHLLRFYEDFIRIIFGILIPCFFVIRWMKNDIFINQYNKLSLNIKRTSEIKFNFYLGLYLSKTKIKN